MRDLFMLFEEINETNPQNDEDNYERSFSELIMR